MGSSRTVVMVCGLSLAWTLSCSKSQTEGSTDPSPAVDAGGSKPDAKVGGSGGPRPPGSGAGGAAKDAGVPPVITKDAGSPGTKPDAATPPTKPDAAPPPPTTPPPTTTPDAATPPPPPTTPPPTTPPPPPPPTTPPPTTPDASVGTGGTGAGGSPARPVVTRRVAVFGDYGGDTADEAAVAALVAKWNPDAVFTVGDNNYVSGTFDGYDTVVGKDYHSFIGTYRGKYGAGASTNRFWPALGDHDWELGVGGYTDYFTLPGNERYYDVDLGPVHLYAINSNAEEPDGYTPSGAQGTWLKNKLAASTSCFDFVYFHHPPYSSGYHGSRTYMDWPFAAWGAEATFAGHDHNYERLEVSGIPYFVVGMGGLGLRPFPGAPLPQTKFRDDKSHGAVLITASSNGTITYEFWSTAGVKLDSLTVTKTCS